ncbi:MAG: glycosyltransferase family 39 protein [Chloroflexota bacterium]
MFSRPIWYDEAFSILFSQKGPAAMLYGTVTASGGAAAEVHPLAYYYLLWEWMRIWGDSLVAARLLSVLLGMGVVVLAYLLGRELWGEEAWLLPFGLVVLSPFQIHYSQEIRMYALLTALLLLATLAMWRGIHTRQIRWWLTFGLAAALAQYTHNLAFTFLLPLALTPVFLREWRALRAVVLSGLGALVLYIPWLFHLPSQMAMVEGGYWIPAPTLTRLFTTLLAFVVNLPIAERWLPLALFATLFPTALAVWQSGKAGREKLPHFRRGLWLAYLAISPPLLLLLVSLWRPVYIERALLPSGVFFLLWLGWALRNAGLPRAMFALALVLLLPSMVMGIVQHVSYDSFPYAPWEGIGKYLTQRVETGEVILHSNKLTMLPMVYAAPDLPQHYLVDTPGSGTDTLSLPTQQVLGLMADPNPEVAVGEARGAWFILFSREIDEYQALGFGSHPQLDWLEGHFHREQVTTWEDVLLYEYTR